MSLKHDPDPVFIPEDDDDDDDEGDEDETSLSRNRSTEPPGILRDRAQGARPRDNYRESRDKHRKQHTDIPRVLPHEKVFPIQIGNQLFRLSGASISSDAPSYFSQFFVCQLQENGGDDATSVRTLYIDRDPTTFNDISLHLQGYHVSPRDSLHFVKLFADAQFYSLPRLVSQLYEESIFITIGHRDFQIPRELFSDPGNSPNFFSLGFAVFFSSPTEVFPGLDREGLLRPPSILPPSVPNCSGDTFAELLHLLQGYPLKIRSEEHRAELLKDCRYFHFKGLEQRVIRHAISWNSVRLRHEIVLRLEDVRQSGISVAPEQASAPIPDRTTPPPLIAFIHYARPFVDKVSRELVLEIGDECTKLHFPNPSSASSMANGIRAEFFGDGKSRVSRLFEVIATKLNLPTSQPLGLLMKGGGATSQPPSPGNTPISEDWVKVEVGEECFVSLDGEEWRANVGPVSKKRKGTNDTTSSVSFTHGIGAGKQPSRKRRRIDMNPISNPYPSTSPEEVQDHISISSLNDGDADADAELDLDDESHPNAHNHPVPQPEIREREGPWIIKTAQWRLRVQQSMFLNPKTGKGGAECVLVGVRIEAVRDEWGRNRARGFLSC